MNDTSNAKTRFLTALTSFFSRLALYAKVAFSETVFWAKHHGGFVDLVPDTLLIGTVRSVVFNPDDGDTCINVEPDRDFEGLLYYKGRLTKETEAPAGTIHCEFMPRSLLQPGMAWKLGQVQVGDQVRIVGTWAYDGVHTGKGLFFDIVKVIVGGAPDEAGGWTEIHPCQQFDILPSPYFADLLPTFKKNIVRDI